MIFIFKSKILVPIVIFLSLFAIPAHAQIHVDLYGGPALPDADETSLRASYMLVGGYKFDFGLSLGGVFHESTKDEDRGRFEYVLKGVEASYFFDDWIKGFYLAFRAGLVDVETELSGVEFKTNPFGWGWYLGKDFKLNNYFTAGFEGGFLSVNGDEGLVGGAPQTLEKFVSYSLFGSLKLWF